MKIGAFWLLCLLPLAAWAGNPAAVPVFQGLLPKGFVVKDAATVSTGQDLRGKTLAIVASANLEGISKAWVDENDRGGAQRELQGMSLAASSLAAVGFSAQAASLGQAQGVAAAGKALIHEASDPRVFAERMIALVGPYFAKVIASRDVGTALDAGADYVAVIDLYWMTYPWSINSHARSNASLHLFDGNLERVLLAEGKSDMKAWSVIPNSKVKGPAATIATIIRNAGDQIEETVRNKLGPPPAPVPIVPVRTSSPIQQCIDACKANTTRTAEQCFDSCSRSTGP